MSPPAATEKESSQSRLSLRPLTARELPAHPLLAKQQQEDLPTLKDFALDLLQSADELIDASLKSQFKKKGSAKPSRPSAARVQLFSHDIRGATWFARVSKHDNEAKPGTASFDEFVAALYDNHSVHEAEYTPNIYDCVKVLDWNGALDDRTEGAAEHTEKVYAKWGADSGWGDIEELHVEIYEMAHKIPSPISNRVFCTLVVRARKAAAEGKSREFVVVQVPVDLQGTQEAVYTNRLNRKQGSTAERRKDVVVGHYTSVEKLVVAPAQGGSEDEVVWTMATTSDARGNVPMALQKMGVPGAIVKDVGFVLKWIADKRGSKS